MGYYDDPKNTQQYIEMAEGYDGRELIEALSRHLPAGATVLELGMGPGKDLDILKNSLCAVMTLVVLADLHHYKKHFQIDIEVQ